MADENSVSRREFDHLAARVDAIDQQGTRGIGPLSVQLAEVIKDVAEVRRDVREVRTDMESRFDKHEQQHEQEEQRRITSRRWAVGLAVALIAAIDGPVVTILLSRR